jgi:hypothetical protein
LVALAGELGELGSSDHNPEQHLSIRNAPKGMKPKTPEIPPTQGNLNCRKRKTLISAGHWSCVKQVLEMQPKRI